MIALGELGIAVAINPMPCEIADCVPLDQDTAHAAYDADYAQRFLRVLSSAHEVFSRFRTGFLGKASPVHFFWGSFDLAVTRFSGRGAPRHPGGVPHLPNAVAQEAYSHEVSSAGFWPGGGGSPVEYAAFYSYAYPAPEGFAAAKVKPDAALWSKELGEFLLPYDAMRKARDPDAALMEFPRQHLRGGGEPGEMGPPGARMSDRRMRDGEGAVTAAVKTTSSRCGSRARPSWPSVCP